MSMGMSRERCFLCKNYAERIDISVLYLSLFLGPYPKTGCVPSENEINEVISATESEDSNGAVHLSRFLPHVTQLLAEHR